MPINATQEYYEAERKYREAKTIDEKIACLEEVIRQAPKHKGAENLLAQLRSQLSRLKKEKQKQKKKARRSFGIEKEGAAQVCILGFANSGKTQLLKGLTGVGEPSPAPYSTTKPLVGMMDMDGAQLQMVEIPSTFEPRYIAVAKTADSNVFVVDGTRKEEIDRATEFIQSERINNVIVVINKMDMVNEDGKREFQKEGLICISSKTGEGIEELKSEIWKSLGLIRIYTKSFGKPPEKKPVVLKEGSTVLDLAKNIHKDMTRFFKFARVWGSTKFPGAKVGLDYVLRDKDIVEIRMR